MIKDYNYEDALLNQLTAQISNNKRAFYQNLPSLDAASPQDNIVLPKTASWELLGGFGCGVAVKIQVKVGDEVLGGQIHGKFKSSVVGVKNNLPETDYEEVALRIELVCNDMKKSLLNNLAKQHMDILRSVNKGGE